MNKEAASIKDISEQGEVLSEELLSQATGGKADATSKGTNDEASQTCKWDADCDVGDCIEAR